MKNLSDFVDELRRAGELVEVAAPVDPNLEITEIADRVMKSGGPALLFRNVRGPRHRRNIRVVASLASSMDWGLGRIS